MKNQTEINQCNNTKISSKNYYLNNKTMKTKYMSVKKNKYRI